MFPSLPPLIIYWAKKTQPPLQRSKANFDIQNIDRPLSPPRKKKYTKFVWYTTPAYYSLVKTEDPIHQNDHVIYLNTNNTSN